MKQVVGRPLPDSVLQSKLVKRVAGQTSKALEVLSDTVEKAGAGKSTAAKELKTRLDDLRTELDKLTAPKPAAKAKARAPAEEKAPAKTPPKPKRKTTQPMPEMIHTHSGGKRLPAAVAKRAVRKSGDEFKPKKGKKHR